MHFFFQYNTSTTSNTTDLAGQKIHHYDVICKLVLTSYLFQLQLDQDFPPEIETQVVPANQNGAAAAGKSFLKIHRRVPPRSDIKYLLII